MYQLFAFQQSVESEMIEQPGGRYDREQQLWIADETSRARSESPIDQTRVITRGRVTALPDGSYDAQVDVGFDVDF
jgi:hypothetical protein